MILAPGQQVGGLQVEKELGRGAYGVVYLAQDKLLGRLVALKVLQGGGAEVDEDAKDQVLTEARLIGSLQSPYIVRLFRTHPTDDGGWMLELEFVTGGCLEDVFDEGQALDTSEAVRIFRSLCLALNSAHEARVIHGDIKLGNVLFGPDGLVKLTDFGLARVLEGTDAAVPLHGEAFGTPAYMAPEILSGQEAGISSDIWAAGVLFYQLLTGTLPFPAKTFAELWDGIMMQDPEPLPDELPQGLSHLVEACLAKDPDDRPESAAAVLEYLDALTARYEELAPSSLASERPTNLSPPTTTFVGRESDLRLLRALLAEDGVRVATLVGAGGIGKTRLAREACRQIVDLFEGGSWFANLGGAQTRSDVAHAVARALGIPFTQDKDPLDVVAEALRFRKPMLLVLDNCEQILGEVAAALEVWRERAPDVRFLVTSRARLGLKGERTYEVGPLELPTLVEMMRKSPADLRQYSGVALFADRARESAPDYVLADDAIQDVVAICIELDGMPLAIELAAARVKNVSPAEIAANFGAKFDILQSTKVDLVPRQRTLTGAIEWSYGLLADWEKEAFVQASVFRDGFSPEAAAAVLDLSAFPDAPPTLEVVQSLRDNSLLTAGEVRQETRLGMYKAIREFGEQRFMDDATAEARAALSDRHAKFFLDLANTWNRRIPGPRDVEALDRIETDLGNLRAVLDRSIESAQREATAQAALAMTKTMSVRFPPAQLISVLEPALEVQDKDAPDAVRLRVELAAAEMAAGDWDRAEEHAENAEPQARALELHDVLARALLRCGDLARNRGRIDEAKKSFTECAELAKKTGDKWAAAFATGGLGAVAWQTGDMDHAWNCFEQAAALGREIGDHRIVARQLGNLGVVCESRGDRQKAIAYHKEVEELARRKGDRTWVCMSLRNRGTALAQAGDFPGSLRCYREGEAIARELGAKGHIAQLIYCRGSIHSLSNENEQANACYSEAESLWRELGDRRQVAVILGARALILNGNGDVDGALACHLEAEQIADEIGDKIILALNRCYRGGVMQERGELDDAWELMESGLKLFDEMGSNRSVWYFKFAARAATLAGQRDDPASAAHYRDHALMVAKETDLRADHPDSGVGDALRQLGADT